MSDTVIAASENPEFVIIAANSPINYINSPDIEILENDHIKVVRRISEYGIAMRLWYK